MKARLLRICLPFILHPPAFILTSLSSAARVRDVDCRRMAEAPRVLRRDGAFVLFETVAADEADGRAAETPAGHARAEHARKPPRGLGQEVELGAAHLVVVAQRLVRAAHQP